MVIHKVRGCRCFTSFVAVFPDLPFVGAFLPKIAGVLPSLMILHAQHQRKSCAGDAFRLFDSPPARRRRHQKYEVLIHLSMATPSSRWRKVRHARRWFSATKWKRTVRSANTFWRRGGSTTHGQQDDLLTCLVQKRCRRRWSVTIFTSLDIGNVQRCRNKATGVKVIKWSTSST